MRRGETAGAAAAAEHPSVRRAGRLFWRAVRLKCPNCGQGRIFRSWLHMIDHCPRCGLEFERREPGYVVGAYMLNIVAAELVVVAAGLAVVVATWPDPPWQPLMYGGAALVVLLPLASYPVSKTLFLALDLAIRPKGHE